MYLLSNYNKLMSFYLLQFMVYNGFMKKKLKCFWAKMGVCKLPKKLKSLMYYNFWFIMGL